MPDFLIERFCRSNWPFIRGERPFLAAGPKFRAYTTTQALTGYEWQFRQPFIDDLKTIGETGDRLSREVAAELLLREGIVQALWAVNGGRTLPEEGRWAASVAQLADEIPAAAPLHSWVIELLSGIAEPSHYRSYLSETGIELVALEPPGE